MQRNIGIIVAARSGSSRLPGKALLPLGKDPMIIFLLKRLSSSRFFSNVILATTTLENDNELALKVESFGIPVFRGNASDLIARYIDAAEKHNFEYIVRVTGDCPFVDGKLLDYFIEQSFADEINFDLATTKGNFPIGLDFEMISVNLLKDVHAKDDLTHSDREHLTKYFYDKAMDYKVKTILPPFSCEGLKRKYTVDYMEDYEFAKNRYSYFNAYDFSVDSLIELDKNNKL